MNLAGCSVRQTFVLTYESLARERISLIYNVFSLYLAFHGSPHTAYVRFTIRLFYIKD
jgi:hypothetical protein